MTAAMEIVSFDKNIISNPRIYEQNREDAHSDHKYYKDKSELLSGESSYTKSLNGKWKFSLAKTPDDAENGFFEDGFNDNGFDYINVPGHIQTQNFVKPNYTNTVYPFSCDEDVDITKAPQKNNFVGQYVCYFDSVDDWENTHICFEGVDNAFALWLNGHYVGYSTDSFTPSSFDLTKFMKKGQNRLCVQVFRYTVFSYLEDQDFWRLTGIFRPVYLYTKPKAHLNDLFVKQTFNDDLTSVELNVELKLSENSCCDFRLMDAEGKCVAEGVSENSKIVKTISDPVLWSAEKPYLYTLELTVKDESGKVFEVVRQDIGFRKFELKDRQMLINGKRIIFKGINRHEFSAKTGRTMTDEEIYEDLLIIKRHNMNAVRTSHYPNKSCFYEYCDRLGLYVIDETNLETHGSWQELDVMEEKEHTLPRANPDYRDAVLDRGRSMLERDKNHACVIIWSCGNESWGGKTLFELSEYFRNTDPSRLVHYEGLFHDRSYNATSDMESHMYSKVSYIREFMKEHDDKPIIMCEYTHSMGNSNGGMKLYTDLAKEGGLYQGGFIWDFCDQALITKNDKGQTYLAYGGDFGDRPTDFNFCGNGIIFADRRLSPKVNAVKYNYQDFEIKVEKTECSIKNYSLFTNLDEFETKAVLKLNGKVVETISLGRISLAPSESTKVSLKFENPMTTPGEYSICITVVLAEDTAYEHKGYEIAFEDAVVCNVKSPVKTAGKKAKLVATKANFGVVGDNFRYIFHNGRGLMVSKQNHGVEQLKAPCEFNFFRAPTDNDYGAGMPFDMGVWKVAGRYAKTLSYEASEKDGVVTISYVHALCSLVEAKVYSQYVIDGEGRIEVTLTYEKAEGMPEIPEFGMLFKLYGSFDKVSYYGLGPDENYSDRLEGSRLGVFSNTVKDMYVDYLIPQECGNRCGVREYQIKDSLDNSFTLLKQDRDLNVSSLPYSPDELESARHAYELPDTLTTVVKVSCDQMGVGGDDSWGAPVLEQYRIPNSTLKCRFVLL